MGTCFLSHLGKAKDGTDMWTNGSFTRFGMIGWAERHRFLRHFVVQDQGASNRVSHENKNVIDEHFYFIFVFVSSWILFPIFYVNAILII